MKRIVKNKMNILICILQLLLIILISYLWLSLSCAIGGECSPLLWHKMVAHCLNTIDDCLFVAASFDEIKQKIHRNEKGGSPLLWHKVIAHCTLPSVLDPLFMNQLISV